MSDSHYDLAIIGAGPGGYVSAIRAAHHGLRVALVDPNPPGGVCLHTGCIPTKTMVASVDLLRQAQQSSQLAVSIAQAEAQLASIVERRQKVVAKLAAGVQNLIDKNGVDYFSGRGRLKSPTEIEVIDGEDNVTQTLANPRAIILATGSRPTKLPIAPRDGEHILNSDDLLTLTELPPRLLILGGGYIGCEFASIFAALGSEVTVLEAKPCLLPGMDPDLCDFLRRGFKRQNITVRLNETVQSATATAEGVTVQLADETLEGTHLLVAVGRTPNTEDLGLEAAGVTLDGRAIGVDEFLKTNVPNIFAIGDVTGKMQLAHVATAQGRVVVDNLIANENEDRMLQMNYDEIPAAVFTHPEIATIGLTVSEAEARGIPIRMGRFPFAAIGKALAQGETDGFVKLIAHAETGKLLGGHILGGHAAELIGQITLAIKLNATAEQLTETIFAHPTLSEAILEAAESLFGQSTHLPKPRERK
ncbi:MAG: dihydrolipoyl dehydrogenase [Verrucomicrobiales bacterium]|nr:dihydrolipoyl dehydrogenase [Verrucomicrobiales bacterium]